MLLVEFCGDEPAPLLSRLAQLTELMGDLGLPGSVVEMVDPVAQQEICGRCARPASTS